MKVFISHASKDAATARQLSKQLRAAGYSAWLPEDEILPGDNWSKRVGQALEDSDIIIVLVTPNAFDSELLTREVQYGLTADHIRGRVIPVFIGHESNEPSRIPWILEKLNPVTVVEEKMDWQKVIEKVDAIAG